MAFVVCNIFQLNIRAKPQKCDRVHLIIFLSLCGQRVVCYSIFDFYLFKKVIAMYLFLHMAYELLGHVPQIHHTIMTVITLVQVLSSYSFFIILLGNGLCYAYLI